METSDPTTLFEFNHGGIKTIVNPVEVSAWITEFLDLYAEEPLVDTEFSRLVGDGDGSTRFRRLLAAVGRASDPEGFVEDLLKILANRAEAEDESKEILLNGVGLPYHLMLAVLELFIPQEKILNVKTVRQLQRYTGIRVAEDSRQTLQRVLDLYPVRLSNHVVRQMVLSDAVAYQYMPHDSELDPGGLTHTWVGQFHRGVIEQMYRNRVIFILNMNCPVYCRFCFRKHKECRNQRPPTQKDVSDGLTYLRESCDVKEVVLTGGDPFLNRATLTWAVDGLLRIPHVETVRIATRSIAYHPALFTAKDGFWLDFLKRKQIEYHRNDKQIEVATHFVHPDEISRQALEVISDLTGVGVPVYVQTPFLGGCNDDGPELVELYRVLRGAGAEMHYIFMPCSPILGNRRYESPVSDGIRAAAHLRAHLSDRAMPHLCTATSIGKIDWGGSGWAVEVDAYDSRYLWLRTPYSTEYFESFAPLLNLTQIARANSEGTLDAKFMVEIGDHSLIQGSREKSGMTRSFLDRETFPDKSSMEALHEMQASMINNPDRFRSVVTTGSDSLDRVHETRVELQCDVTDEEIGRNLEYINSHVSITDVVLHSPGGTVPGMYQVSRVVERLGSVPHVNAVRLRSPAINHDPGSIKDGVIRKLASMNRLSAVRPLRLEMEAWFLHADEITAEHKRLVKAFRRHGITVYCNIPLLAFINDSEEEMLRLTSGCRRTGMEVNHLYVAGLDIQREWNRRHPIHSSQVIDLASHLRCLGSGRELPRYVIRTVMGEVDFGTTCRMMETVGECSARIALLPYDIEYYRGMDKSFTFPADMELDHAGHPIVAVEGLVV